MNCKQLSRAELFKAGKENSAVWGELCNGDREGRAGGAAGGRLTCTACWTPSHSPARRTQMASPSCALAHGSWGCRRWGRPCRSPPGYRQRCTLLGESSGGCAGCLLCCRCGDSPQRCTGTALPGRQRTPQQQDKRAAQALAAPWAWLPGDVDDTENSLEQQWGYLPVDPINLDKKWWVTGNS